MFRLGAPVLVPYQTIASDLRLVQHLTPSITTLNTDFARLLALDDLSWGEALDMPARTANELTGRHDGGHTP